MSPVATPAARRPDPALVRLALPKGRMQDGVMRLLADAGVRLTLGRRGYRPTLSLPGFDTKVLKPQNIVEMLHVGSRDLGLAGADWVAEHGVELVELLDTKLDPVSVVLAAPPDVLDGDDLPARPFTVATEYRNLTEAWVAGRGLPARVVRAYGATEVFPPEDADCVVDNTATGETLRANGLVILDTLMTSSTRLYAHPSSLEHPAKRERIEHLTLLLRSVIDARERVMVELNVPEDRLEEVASLLEAHCMREPTVATLHRGAGYALKAAVRRAELPGLIPRIKAAGGSDVVVFGIAQIVP